MIDKMWGQFDDFLPKSIHNKLIRSGSICTVGNGDKMLARTCGPTCTKCLLTEKKDAADSLLKFQRALTPDATLFFFGVCRCVCFFCFPQKNEGSEL